MKTTLIFYLIILLGFTHVNSQSEYNITIKDADNDNLLEAVVITQIKEGSTFLSPNGVFNISVSGLYKFSKDGYFSKSLTINSSKTYVIKLKKQPDVLDEIVINASHLPISLESATSSSVIISSNALQRGNNTNLNATFNRVPGVFMQSGTLNTNRITIRGVGSRNLYGTAKIRAYFKDIPLTNGSGETGLEDFELGAISKIEIIKGATSGAYGAGLGGVIRLLPETSFNDNYIGNETTFGSFGLIKNLSRLNIGNTSNMVNVVYSNTESDGYRDNNNYKRQAFSLNSVVKINSNNELTVFGTYSKLKAFIPSSISETDYLNNPTSAAFTWKASKGFEDTQRGILGVSLNHKFKTNLYQTTSVFISFRNSYEPRPFNILDESVLGYGARHRLNGNFTIYDRTLTWTSGIELFKDHYNYQTFENLYEDYPEGYGSVEGSILSDFKETRQYYNLFLEGRYNIISKTDVVFSLNYNKTSYNLEDRYPVSDTNPNQSGSFKFKGLLSPKIGVLYRASSKSNLFANISHGFSLLSLQETLLPNGQINNNLNPETGWNYEVGTRGSAFNKHFTYNLSIYRLAIKNLLVARRTSQDEFIGVNAGKTYHDGVELDLNYNFINSENIQLSAFGNYALDLYKFRDFVDDDNDFSGNDLTGVPKSVLNLGIDFNSEIGIYAHINTQYVGVMPMNDSNSLNTNAYTITNLKLCYGTTFAPKFKTNIHLGLNNIFNTKYASQILINATGFGNSAPRYYYPGNPVNYYAGIALNYSI